MKGKMKEKSIAGLIVIAAIVAVVIFTGCVGKYSVDSAVDDGSLAVNMSGPAEDLAVIFTNPEGYTSIRYISKNQMIDNFEGVSFSMCKGRSPPAGTYKLVVKTVTPEKVVYKTEMKFKPAIVQITDAKVTLKWHDYLNVYQMNYEITVKNDGELPILLDNVLIDLDGKEIESCCIFWANSGESEIYKRGSCSSGITDEWRVPNLAKIELYSEGNKIASFETEIVVEY